MISVRLGFDNIAEFLREKGAFFMSKDDLHQPILGDRKVLFSGLKYVLQQVCLAFPSLEFGEVFTPCKHSEVLLPCSVWYSTINKCKCINLYKTKFLLNLLMCVCVCVSTCY